MRSAVLSRSSNARRCGPGFVHVLGSSPNIPSSERGARLKSPVITTRSYPIRLMALATSSSIARLSPDEYGDKYTLCADTPSSLISCQRSLCSMIFWARMLLRDPAGNQRRGADQPVSTDGGPLLLGGLKRLLREEQVGRLRSPTRAQRAIGLRDCLARRSRFAETILHRNVQHNPRRIVSGCQPFPGVRIVISRHFFPVSCFGWLYRGPISLANVKGQDELIEPEKTRLRIRQNKATTRILPYGAKVFKAK